MIWTLHRGGEITGYLKLYLDKVRGWRSYSEVIGDVGEWKVVHLIIEYDACWGRHYLWTKDKVDSAGDSHSISICKVCISDLVLVWDLVLIFYIYPALRGERSHCPAGCRTQLRSRPGLTECWSQRSSGTSPSPSPGWSSPPPSCPPAPEWSTPWCDSRRLSYDIKTQLKPFPGHFWRCMSHLSCHNNTQKGTQSR